MFEKNYFFSKRRKAFLGKNLSKLPLLLFLLAALSSVNLQAQGYIDCATIIADDENFYDINSFKSFTENGYTYFVGSPSINNAADQFFPVINGSPYFKSTTSSRSMGYLAVWDNNCNQVLGTYIGGAEDDDFITSVKVDSDGNIIVAGWTESSDFMTTDGTATTAGVDAIFIRKYQLDGTILLSTIIGGGVSSYSNASLVLDGTDIYLTGTTGASSFPTTDGSTFSGSTDVFAVKMDGDGNVIYSTVYGGANFDYAHLATINNGNLVISGYTRSPDYPATDGSVHSGSGDDVFLTILDNTGNIAFNTVTGGSADDFDNDDFRQQLITDGTAIYFAGTTRSLDFPTTDGSVHDADEAWDVYLQKYDLSGNLIYSKLIGGNNSDFLQDMELVNGAIYLYGSSLSADFPVVSGTGFAGGRDAFVIKLDANTGNIIYSTLYGGISFDDVLGFKVINTGEVYFTAWVSNPPTTDGSSTIDNSFVIGKLNADGSLCAATQLPVIPFDSHNDEFDVINDTLYLLQYVFFNEISTDGTTAFQFSGDFAMMKFHFCPEPPTIPTNNLSPATQNVCVNSLVGQILGEEHTINGSTQTPIYVDGVLQNQRDITLFYQWQVSTSASGPWTDIAGPVAQQKNYTPPPTSIDQYYRRITKTTECCGGTTVSTSSVAAIIVGANAAPTVDAGGVFYTCPGENVTLNATVTGGTPGYMYSWNDGAFTIEDPTVAPTESTVYTLLVTDANGCQQIDQATVVIYSANAGTDTDVCAGAGTTIGGAALAGVPVVAAGDTPPAGQNSISYAWTPATGLSCADCPNPTATPTSLTEYTLTVTINQADGGSCMTSDMVSVNVFAAPASAVTINDAAICLGETLQLSTNPAPLGNPTINSVSQSSGSTTATPATLTDGDLSTRAGATNDGTGQHITVDLGTAQTINQVALASGGFDYQFTIMVSIDDVTYTDLGYNIGRFETDRLSNNLLTTFSFIPITARYVRLSSISGQRDVDVSEFIVAYDYNYIWTPGSYLTTDGASAIFDAGNLDIPTPNPITYTLSATLGTCTFYEQVSVAVIEARAHGNSPESECGPTTIGEPDRTSDINETYSWRIIPELTTGDSGFLGATDELTVPVSATSSGQTAYELTSSYTFNGALATCYDTVYIVPCGCSMEYFVESNGCPDFDLGNVGILATADLGDNVSSEAFDFAWTPTVGLDRYDNDYVELTDNVERTYTVTATSKLDPSTVCTMMVPVNQPSFAEPIFNATSLVTACSDTPVNIGDPANNPGLTYAWTNGEFLDNVAISYPLATVDRTTEFIVTVTDNVTGCAVMDTIVVEVPQVANAGPDLVVCDNAILTVGGNTELAGYTYSWSPAGSDWRNGTDETNAMPDVFIATTQTLTLTVTDPTSTCTTSDEVTLTVESLPPFFTLPDLTYCPSQADPLVLGTNDGTATGTNQVPTGFDYSWSPATVSDATAINPTVNTPLPTTSFTYEVRVATPGGCNVIATQTINPSLDAPLVSDNKTICLGESVFIGDAANTTGGGETYSWSPTTDLDDPTAANPEYSPSAAGSTTFTLTKTVGACSSTKQVTITVNEATTPTLTPQTICAGGSVQIGVTNDPNLLYDWFPATGLDNATIANPTFSGTSSTNYTLTIIDANGCTAETSTSVTINPAPAVSITLSDTTTCDASTTSLVLNAGVAPAGNYAYRWTPTTYLDNPNILNPTFFVPTEGTYEYVLEVIDQSTGCSIFDTTTMNVLFFDPGSTVSANNTTICEGADATLSVAATGAGLTYQWQSSTTDCTTGFSNVIGATSMNLTTPVQQETYFRVIVMDATGTCRDTSNCLQISINDNPTAAVFAIQPSCLNDVPQSDGYLQISQATNADRFHWSTGSTFDDNGGTNTFANATSLSGVTFPYQFNTGLSNADVGDFTIRVYNGVDDCFTDVVVSLVNQDCTLGCACNDYLYLAEPADGTMHKFLLDGTFPLPEIGMPWYGGSELPNPHGVATDINGFLYVGETNDISVDDGTNIRKLSCDGEIFSETNFSIDDAGNNFQSIGNTLYVTGGGANGIRAYDLCTGNLIGSTACSLLGSWELNYNKDTDTFIWGNQDTGIYRFSSQELEDAIATGGCFGAPLIPPTTYTDTFYTVGDNFLIRTTNFDDFTTGGICNVWGITSDNNGNIYAAQSCASGDYTKIVKFDSNGQFVAETPVANNTNSLGYQSTLGIRYHAGTDLIYLANWQATADCVSAWDTDLTNYIQAVSPSGATGGGAGKAVNILTECCPINNRQVVNETFCVSGTNDPLFLNEVFPCDGTICEGEWIPADAASTAIFDPCNQTIMANVSAGCYSFTKSSDGLGNNLQCGAFVMTFNLEILEVMSPVVIGNQTVCDGANPAPFTATSTASGASSFTYQWQSSTTSCTAGFSDIIGADSINYDPGVLTDTTYYRLITTGVGNCTSGMCTDTSDCLTIVTVPCDWGDLSDTSAMTNAGDYQTLDANNGPVHIINPNITLGSTIDGETDGQSSPDALGDGADEDGLVIFESLNIAPGGTLRLPLSYTNTTGSPAQIEAWIDWDNNGEFDAGEMVLDVTDPSAGLYDQLEVMVPTDAVTGEFLGLRIRISNQDDMTPYGLIDGGEVEDYLIGLECPTQICLPIDVVIKK